MTIPMMYRVSNGKAESELLRRITRWKEYPDALRATGSRHHGSGTVRQHIKGVCDPRNTSVSDQERSDLQDSLKLTSEMKSILPRQSSKQERSELHERLEEI